MSRVKRAKVLTETLHLERRVRCSVSTSQTATEMLEFEFRNQLFPYLSLDPPPNERWFHV